MEVLLEVVERMKERKTAPILAQMNPERAKTVTLELAQRRELPIPRN
jgi:flagellar motility protein MotE (MotC chaperone)